MSLLRKSDEHGEFSKERPELIAMDAGGVEDAMAAAFGREWTSQGPPTFVGVINEVLEMHDRKNRDYGTDADPFANVRQSEQFGVPPWLGAIVRLNDKITRIKAWTRNKSLANESLRDSLIDIVVYGAIAVTLFDQEQDSDRTFCP